MNATARLFLTDEQKHYVRENYPNTGAQVIAEKLGCNICSVYKFAQRLGLRKSAEFLASSNSGRLTGNEGKATRFQKGQQSHNKGLRRLGYSRGNMATTQFKKGERQGVANNLYKPVGSTRISIDGYHETKINDEWPMHRRWRFTHLVLWEEHLGPLPKGFCVTFKNGNKNDIRIDNLRLISRSEMMKKNTLHNYPIEITHAYQLIGAINRQINKRARNEKQNSRPA